MEPMTPSHWSIRRQVSRYYAFANENRSESWWDINNYEIPLAQDNFFLKFDLACLIGTGRYGAVYKTYFYENYDEYDIKKEEKYAIKVLKHTDPARIKNEIKVRI